MQVRGACKVSCLHHDYLFTILRGTCKIRRNPALATAGMMCIQGGKFYVDCILRDESETAAQQ